MKHHIFPRTTITLAAAAALALSLASCGVQPSGSSGQTTTQQEASVSERVEAVIRDKIKGQEATQISAGSRFQQDLGADPLDFMEFVLAIEKEFDFDIPTEAAKGFATVGDLVSYLEDNTADLTPNTPTVPQGTNVVPKVEEILRDTIQAKEVGEITLDSRIVEDLGADTLDRIEIIIALEGEFKIDISDAVADKLLTVRDIVDHIQPIENRRAAEK